MGSEGRGGFLVGHLTDFVVLFSVHHCVHIIPWQISISSIAATAVRFSLCHPYPLFIIFSQLCVKFWTEVLNTLYVSCLLLRVDFRFRHSHVRIHLMQFFFGWAMKVWEYGRV